MPLTRIVVPPDLISFADNAVRLNREKYPELRSVEGGPAVSNRNRRYADAAGGVRGSASVKQAGFAGR